MSGAAIARLFAQRLRANADYARRTGFSTANLSVMAVVICDELAAWIDAQLAAGPPVFVETENPEDRYVRDAEIACPHCRGSGLRDDVSFKDPA